MTDAALSPTERSTIRRGKDRAVRDRSALYHILDAGMVCHLAVVIDGAPRVLPTGYGRDGNTLYIHGSSGAASLRAADGVDVCVAVTMIDGVVYARSVFHHSVNYRSAMVHGVARRLADDERKLAGLRAITEHLAPGSWQHCRPPTKKELAQTTVLALELTEASVKMRTGGPREDDDDVLANTAWAGVLPIETRWGTPIPDAEHPPATPIPAHVTRRATSALYRLNGTLS
ncbi:MAG: pyridoxamine 5'-phosphate oxidase family protein [Sciscionella sp.]|nr:pyridoxamine 5'-phosphate oxidase family protein [Sciscionella sp.]